MARLSADQPHWTPQQTQRNTRLLGVAAFLVFVLLVSLFVVDQIRLEARNALQRDGEFQLQLARVTELQRDMETSQRGFLLTGEESSLEPYRQAQILLPDLFARLRDTAPLVGSESLRQINQIESLTQAWQTTAEQGIAARRETNQQPAADSVNLAQSKQLFDRLRTQQEAAASYVQTQSVQLNSYFSRIYAINVVLLGVVSLIMIATLGYSVSLVRRIGLFASLLQVRQDRVQAYSRVVTALNGPTEMEQLVQSTLPTVLQAVGAQAGVVYVLEQELLRPVATLGLTNEQLPTLRTGEGLPGAALEQNRTLAVTDLPADTPFRVQTGIGLGTPRSIVNVPLRFGSEKLGVLTVASLAPMQEDEVQQLRLVATQLATAISNVHAFEDIAQQREELRLSNVEIARRLEENETLQEMGRELAKQRDLQPLLDLVCREARRLLHADYTAVATQVDAIGSTRWVAAEGLISELARDTTFPPHQGTAGRVIAQAAPVVLDGDQAQVNAAEFPVHTAEGMRSALGVPLFRKDEPIGALIIGYRRPQEISEEMIDLGTALAAYASVAIENARLLAALSTERDLVKARAREMEEKNREVERANRLKSEFVANMSHELRTPLNSILALSQILGDELDGELNAEQLKQVSIIERNGQNLLRLINDILDLSKIESGKLELMPSSFVVRDLIENVRSTIMPLVEEKHLKLVLDLAPSLPRMMTDENKLKQILLNLLSNAVKFTERGEITIRVHAGREVGTEPRSTPFSDWLTFEVADTGIGIKGEDLPTIWEEFQQIDGSLSRRYEGTGLGLAIVRRLVDLLGGEIVARSVLGAGSSFIFSIPALLAYGPQVIELGGEPRPELGERVTVERFRQAHKPVVLVVDDDPEVIYILEKYLYDDGYEIEVAQNGEDAITKARQLQPFAITLDVMLPGRDGWDVIQVLKGDPQTADIPIIMLSMLDNRQLGYSLGATDYLVKPVSRNDLLHRLERLRNGHPLQHILVVDDDPIEQRVLVTALHDLGMTVESCSNGPDALRWLEQYTPDLITLDLMMPGMDGFTVLEAIKAREDLKHVPVLIITAKEITAEDRQRLNSHIAAIIQKGPQQRDDLLAEVGETLKRQRLRQTHRGS